MVFPVVPLMVGMAAAGTAIGSGYDLARAYEQREYLKSYVRHTRRPIKYPMRAGYYDMYKAVGKGMASFGYSGAGFYRGFSSQYRPRYGSRTYDPMYS